MTKSSAIAHPIQGLIKYHGLREPGLRIPYHDSISVCVGPFATHTTVELDPQLSQDVVEIDGQVATGRARERVEQVLNHVRQLAKTETYLRVKSRNNFPSNIGLGASSSGFAALAKAACDAFGLELELRQLSTIARLGAGSACRSVTGGYSYWYAGDDHSSSYSYRLATGSEFPLGVVVVFIHALKNTEDAHREAETSPLFSARLEYIPRALQEMRKAIERRDIQALGQLAEQDTLHLHAITMTGKGAPIYWRPQTLEVMLEVRRMRQEERLPVYFSIDTGATVYLNAPPDLCQEIAQRFVDKGFSAQIAYVAKEVHSTSEHLF
ncbi:MAG: diphosphomevalonate decarboxylase [Planctomycetota bacterium]|nr:MAG: diphosphomevalonate decarboxylase [Planctomycetota bacterium]